MGSFMSRAFKVSATINISLYALAMKGHVDSLGLPGSQRQFYTHIARKSMGPLLSGVNVPPCGPLFTSLTPQSTLQC